MKQLIRRTCLTRLFLALSLFFLPGLTSLAQTWPATSPSLSELPIPAGTLPQPTTPEWVNCDMFSYVDGSDTYQLLAVTYDDLNSNMIYIAVYDSKTGIIQVVDVPNARHPDVVIGQDEDTLNKYIVAVSYENLNTGAINVIEYEIMNVGSSPLSLGFIIDHPFDIGKNAHIDLLADAFHPHNGSPAMHTFFLSYEKNNGSTDQIFVTYGYLGGSSCAIFPPPPPPAPCDPREYITDGIRPDIAVRFDAATGNIKLYIIYYKYDFSTIKLAEVDLINPNYLTYIISGINTLESNFNTFFGYPRIDASNLLGTSNTPWHAVAECTPEGGSLVEIHGYNNDGSFNVIDYGMAKSEYSPTVTVANGDATLGNPADVGNDGYTVGWNVFGAELNALYLDENNTSTVNLGYDQVNTTPLGLLSYGSGKNLFAMTSSTNSGLNLAAAWWDGSDIQLKLVNNSFAFKPTTVNLTSRKNVMVHPNPATNQLFVSGLKKGEYSITNLLGAQVSTGTVNGSAAIDITTLPVGTYILNIAGDKVTEHIKFIKE